MAGIPRSRNIILVGLLLMMLAFIFHMIKRTTSPKFMYPATGSSLFQNNYGVPEAMQVQPLQQHPVSFGTMQMMNRTLHRDVLVATSYPSGQGTHDQSQCVALPQSPKPGVKICVHSNADDRWVSGTIKKGSLWEGDLVRTMKAALETNPNMQLLDIGANIGEFALFAAALGRPVLAVEMLPKNVLAIQTSLQLSQLSPLVTIVQNALYRDRRTFGIKVYKGNIGGTALDTQSPVDGKKDPETIMQTVLLDDLIPLVNVSRPAFMKLDIETSEQHAIAGGQNFLKAVDVPFIQMEWNHKPYEAREELLNILGGLGYVASKKCLTYEPVDMLNFTKNMNVYFVKKSFYDAKQGKR